MKITLTPETPEDEQRLRERAASGTGSVMSSSVSLTRALTRAAEEWVVAHPRKPGPGSVLRWNYPPGSDPIRIVREDGSLMDLNGTTCNATGWWAPGSGEGQYTVLFDSSEAS